MTRLEDASNPGSRRGRPTGFYIGHAASFVGIVILFSMIALIYEHFSEFTGERDFKDFAGVATSMALRTLVGTMLWTFGRGIRGVGVGRVARPQAVLDPDRAPKDLPPSSRASGGQWSDGLDEPDKRNRVVTRDEVVMIPCPACRNLNEEDSRFCGKCGQKI